MQKSGLPAQFVSTLASLMYQLLPGYQYAIDYPSDPVNDITIVRSLPVGARGALQAEGLLSHKV